MWVNGTGPTAALSLTMSQAKYDYSLSYLTGQRLLYVISAVPTISYLIFCPVCVPALARTTQVQAPTQVIVHQKLMYLKPSTINWVLVV